MKKISVALSVAAFVAVYAVMCFAVPSLRIKLSASPAEYFLVSIRHMALFKVAVSFCVGAFVGVASAAIFKSKLKTHRD